VAAGLALLGATVLLLIPAGAFASTPTSPSVSASPTSTPSPAGSPSPQSSASPSPSATGASPSASANPIDNRAAQDELLGDLTASEAHAVLLESALAQSQSSLVALGQQILDGQNQVAEFDRHIAAVTQEHQDVSTRLAADRQQLSSIIRELYKHQNNFFVNLLEAGGFGGLLETIGYGDVVVDREKHLVREVQADDVALAHAQTMLERSRQKEQATLTSLQLDSDNLSNEMANEQSLQTQLQATVDQALSALDAMQTDTPEMATQRANLIKLKTDSILVQIEQAVFAQESLTSTGTLIVPDPILAATGKLLWPVPFATITQGFGPTTSSYEAAFAGFPHFHTGIDLAVAIGTPVFAAADGVVLFARGMQDSTGALIGYGNYVVIQHDAGLKTLYAHLLSIAVKEGDVVKRGQLIGLVGSTGNSTGPHTHFEVRVDNSPVDPMQMLPAVSTH
jgi:murein DD-endopeptidase MepM/ murein hydrolase activator NlpD